MDQMMPLKGHSKEYLCHKPKQLKITFDFLVAKIFSKKNVAIINLPIDLDSSFRRIPSQFSGDITIINSYLEPILFIVIL